MDIVRGIFECIKGSVDDGPAASSSHAYQPTSVSEKADLRLLGIFDQSTHTSATNAVLTLQRAEKAGQSLEAAIEDIVTQAGGWSEQIAKSILSMLQNILKEGSPMGPAMKEAYDKACKGAVSLGEFIHDHPIFCTVIALGILIILAPTIIHALGFGALGPIEGRYTSRYDGTQS